MKRLYNNYKDEFNRREEVLITWILKLCKSMAGMIILLLIIGKFITEKNLDYVLISMLLYFIFYMIYLMNILDFISYNSEGEVAVYSIEMIKLKHLTKIYKAPFKARVLWFIFLPLEILDTMIYKMFWIFRFN